MLHYQACRDEGTKSPRLPEAPESNTPPCTRGVFFVENLKGGIAGTLLQSGVLGSAAGFSCQAQSIPSMGHRSLYTFSAPNARAPFLQGFATRPEARGTAKLLNDAAFRQLSASRLLY